MQEAKYSVNIRFNLRGFDCQFTARSEDEPGIETLKKVPSILAELEKLGACGERRWEKVKNGNGYDKEVQQAQPKGKSGNDSTGGQEQRAAASVRGYYFPDAKGTTGVVGELPQEVCPHCGVVGQVEVIGFKRSNAYKQAPKCQACEKWLPEDK